jgi:hypothetical protein
MGTQCAIKFLIVDLLDFASDVRLKLSRNHTFTNLAIVTNVSICQRWEMTFCTNVLEASCTNWDHQCPQNIKIHGINIHNSNQYLNFLIRKFSTHDNYFKFQHTSKLVVTSWSFILLLGFSQPFNSCSIRSTNHKDGSMVSYQLLFTKPRASNVFDQHCCRVANIIRLTQLHVMCIKHRIKWQCLCINTTQPIYNHQDKNIGKSTIYPSDH